MNQSSLMNHYFVCRGSDRGGQRWALLFGYLLLIEPDISQKPRILRLSCSAFFLNPFKVWNITGLSYVTVATESELCLPL